MLKILVADSGWGGLLITMGLLQQMKNKNHGGIIQYVNLAPSHEQGYNQMPSRSMKLQTFENAFNSTVTFYNPSFIILACNSLSVFLEDTKLAFNQNKIWSVVEEGVHLIVPKLQENINDLVVIFSTETTANEGYYQKALQKSGITNERIIVIPCPNLASTISEGDNQKIQQQVQQVMGLAFQEITKLKPFDNVNFKIYGLLSCTHYTAVKSCFQKESKEYFANQMEILDIKYTFNQNIYQQIDLPLSVSISGKYQINEIEKTTWQRLLAHSKELQNALNTMDVIPNLF